MKQSRRDVILGRLQFRLFIALWWLDDLLVPTTRASRAVGRAMRTVCDWGNKSTNLRSDHVPKEEP